MGMNSAPKPRPTTAMFSLLMGMWVLSAQCSVLSAQCSVLSAQCSVLSAQCSVLSAQCSVLSAQCSVLSVRLLGFSGIGKEIGVGIFTDGLTLRTEGFGALFHGAEHP